MVRSGAEGGNTKPPRISASKRWVFTLHNGVMDEVVRPLKEITVKGIVGNETGKSGETPHLQGFVYFKERIRPIGLLPKETHWAKARGNDEENYKYCSKEGTFESWGYPPPIKVLEPVGWQVQLDQELMGEPIKRRINWYWGPANCGKTEFAKWCVIKRGAIMVGGKSSDMKYAIADWLKKHKETPRLVILDIPFCKQEYISYEGLEQVKNMLFFSSKYESSMVCGNPPHVVVLANREPSYHMMSEKKWFNVVEIKGL